MVPASISTAVRVEPSLAASGSGVDGGAGGGVAPTGTVAASGKIPASGEGDSFAGTDEALGGDTVGASEGSVGLVGVEPPLQVWPAQALVSSGGAAGGAPPQATSGSVAPTRQAIVMIPIVLMI